jgi:hypothetical protein
MYICPVDNKPLIIPIQKGSHKKRSKLFNSYADGLDMAYEGLFGIRFGLSECISFRWTNWRKEINLDYTEKYSNASILLSLYSTAVRQLDPLSEFLEYYRIIENTAQKAHTKWVACNLPKLRDYDFGFLELQSMDHRAMNHKRRKKKSIFRI